MAGRAFRHLRALSWLRRLGLAGAITLFASGGALFVLSVNASATASISVSPNTNLTGGQTVSVTGSGFAAASAGGAGNGAGNIVECNNTPNEPTVIDSGKSLPVGCTSPTSNQVTTDGSGNLPPTSFSVVTGVVGPPTTSGTDSAGNPPATDAALYPCPPTAAQQAAGVTCVIAFEDGAGDQATAQILFTGENPPTSTVPSASTTTTTASPTTTVAPTTTTTTASGCTSGPASVSGPAGSTLSVNPATCLANGEQVAVTGSKLHPSATGAVAECSTASGQPTQTLSGLTWPVGCTPPLTATTDTTGTLYPIMTVKSGVVGPVTSGLDSAGTSATSDATNYPCPPTAAQQAAGAKCEIVFQDSAGDNLAVPITFSAAATAASGSSLAFTGPPRFAWVLAATGAVLLWFGCLALGAVVGPKRRLRRVLALAGHEHAAVNLSRAEDVNTRRAPRRRKRRVGSGSDLPRVPFI